MRGRCPGPLDERGGIMHLSQMEPRGIAADHVPEDASGPPEFSAGVPGLEPRMDEPESPVLPITPYPSACSPRDANLPQQREIIYTQTLSPTNPSYVSATTPTARRLPAATGRGSPLQFHRVHRAPHQEDRRDPVGDVSGLPHALRDRRLSVDAASARHRPPPSSS